MSSLDLQSARATRLAQLRAAMAGSGIDADSLYLPDGDVFVAVLANTDDPATDPSTLTRRLAALAIGDPIPSFTPAIVAPGDLVPLFGQYTPAQGAPLRFFARDGKPYLGRGDDEQPVTAAGGNRFYFGADSLAWFTIAVRPDGAHVLDFHNPEKVDADRAVRSGPAPEGVVVPPAVLQSYAGTYRTEVPTLTVTVRDGRLLIGPAGQEPITLRPVSATEFRVEGSPMRVVFHPENGRVDRLTLYRGARELHGQRVAP